MTQTAAPAPAVIKEPINVGGPVMALVPQNIEQAFRLAEALSKSGDMVPKAFQGKPMETMAAIMRGMEIGLTPMQSLASIAVINGRASVWGDALPALMQRAGHHIDVVIEGSGADAVAVATLTRGDTGRVTERRFSMADARQAGLAGKQGPWQQYPMRMIAVRARAFAIRDGAADALMGLRISDEVSDYGPDAARDVTPAAPRRGGVIYRDPDPEDLGADRIEEAEVAGAADTDPAPTPDEIAAATEAAARAARDAAAEYEDTPDA